MIAARRSAMPAAQPSLSCPERCRVRGAVSLIEPSADVLFVSHTLSRYGARKLIRNGGLSMDAFFLQLGTGGVIGLGLGLIAVLLLSAIAARVSKVIDLLDEIAELITTGSKQQENEHTRVL